MSLPLSFRDAARFTRLPLIAAARTAVLIQRTMAKHRS